MTQKSCLSDQASAIYAILNEVVPLLASHYQVSGQFSILHVILNQVVLQWALKHVLVAYFRKTKNINLPLATIITFSSFGLIVAYSIFTYFISDLMTFIYLVLTLYRNISFEYLLPAAVALITQFLSKLFKYMSEYHLLTIHTYNCMNSVEA